MKSFLLLQENTFQYVSYFSYILYFLVLFGISYSAPKYLYLLNIYMPIYVSLFLLIRFNPWKRFSFTDYDRKIAFQAGIFLLLTTSLNTLLDKYFFNPVKEEAIKAKTKITSL